MSSLKWGAILEFGLIVTQIGTAVVIYPLVRRQSETVSLGYVCARIMESVFAAIGLISIITIVSLAESLVGAGDAETTALMAQGDTLAQMYDWAFRWGPGLVAVMSDRIVLTGMRFEGRHGVSDDERSLPQLIEVDVELSTDLGPAGRSDEESAAWVAHGPLGG